VVEAFAEQGSKRYLIRDRDATYGHEFRCRIQSLGMKEVISAPRSPWQNAFAERMIGSIRLECLDHVVVLSQRHLQKLLICSTKISSHSSCSMSATSSDVSHSGNWQAGSTTQALGL
jgi:hypothetical protein